MSNLEDDVFNYTGAPVPSEVKHRVVQSLGHVPDLPAVARIQNSPQSPSKFYMLAELSDASLQVLRGVNWTNIAGNYSLRSFGGDSFASLAEEPPVGSSTPISEQRLVVRSSSRPEQS